MRVGGVPEHFNLPWKLAITDKALAETGLDVEFIDYPGGTGAMTSALRNGDLDVALVLTEGAVLDILKGGDNRLVSIYVETPLVWGIHVAAGGSINVVEQGQRVAISRFGSGSHLIAVVDAMMRGFDPTTMEFVVVDNLDGARTALANDHADIFLWERHMTQPLVDAGEFRRIGEREVPWPAFVVSARNDFLKKHSVALRSALNIVAGYCQRLKDRGDAAQLISDTYDIASADAERWLSGVRWTNDFEPPTAALERIKKALISQGAIDPSAAIDEVWYSDSGH
jgi:ABC-type nitrate/sulfonate/bicarbonate transport system substrate-binding protein